MAGSIYIGLKKTDTRSQRLSNSVCAVCDQRWTSNVQNHWDRNNRKAVEHEWEDRRMREWIARVKEELERRHVISLFARTAALRFLEISGNPRALESTMRLCAKCEIDRLAKRTPRKFTIIGRVRAKKYIRYQGMLKKRSLIESASFFFAIMDEQIYSAVHDKTTLLSWKRLGMGCCGYRCYGTDFGCRNSRCRWNYARWRNEKISSTPRQRRYVSKIQQFSIIMSTNVSTLLMNFPLTLPSEFWFLYMKTLGYCEFYELEIFKGLSQVKI